MAEEYEREVDLWLSTQEDVIERFEGVDNINIKVLEAIRDELANLGMNVTHREKFIALATVDITVNLNPEQERRIKLIARKVVRNLYTTFSSLGYRDDSIAWMGRQYILELQEK